MDNKLFIISAPPSYDLLTIRAINAFRLCDIVLYDRLIDKSILNEVNCKKIYVGKTPYKSHTSQEQINALIEKYLKDGLNVGRIKGGDAAFFSRAAEEVAIAYNLGIDVEWIAGVGAPSILCERLKSSLTIRGVSNGVLFITGHTKDGDIVDCYDWSSIAKLNMTIVVYMGLKNLTTISNLLIDNGMNGDTPVVFGVALGFDDEHLLFSKLDNVASVKDKLSNPTIIVIGDVLKYIKD